MDRLNWGNVFIFIHHSNMLEKRKLQQTRKHIRTHRLSYQTQKAVVYEVKQRNYNDKSAQREANTARWSLYQKFSPRRRPLPGGVGRPTFNQLEMVTTFTYTPSSVKIDVRNFELSWQQTHKQTNTQTDRTDYNTLRR